ncbi:MAG TPA: A24 family peptidase [Halomonas sp.]|nr:A24 family peptidase [Halomonas sp.]
MSANPPVIFLWPLAALLGLCVGSFLNVVISRLPQMMMREWHAQARAVLELEPETAKPFNLLTPASHCPGCQTAIAWHDNLPLLGWLKRRGRCVNCAAPISPRYPLVEMGGGLLALASVAIYGATPQAIFIAGACLALLAMAVIDLRTRLLPDALTLPLLWAGLLYQLVIGPIPLGDAVIGAMAGYLALWSFYWLFKLITGKEGMGYGDFKLLAALGAWLGWQYLPPVLILSAGLGALIGILVQLAIPRLRGAPLPFGPWLALAGWVALLVGEPLMNHYLATAL